MSDKTTISEKHETPHMTNIVKVTDGENKKSKITAIIAIVLVVIILVGGGVLVLPKLLGNNDSQEPTIADTSASIVTDENAKSDSNVDDTILVQKKIQYS